jgi:apolipoprotein N-acyltransferase
MTAAGAEMFVVPIMDAEKWTAREHAQHAELFRIRACENGRWMFVCGSSGVSQIIDSRGRVRASLPSMFQGTLAGAMRRETAPTFYTRFDWVTPWCLLAFATIAWGLVLWPRRWGRNSPRFIEKSFDRGFRG